MADSLHVYRYAGAWTVQKEGSRAATFGTKREALDTALRSAKKAKSAQVVVHGKDGRVLESRSYGMPRVQDSPKRGRLTNRKIATAVGRVVLDRLQTDRALAPEK